MPATKGRALSLAHSSGQRQKVVTAREKAQLQETILSDAVLDCVDFACADLHGSRFERVCFRGTHFRRRWCQCLAGVFLKRWRLASAIAVDRGGGLERRQRGWPRRGENGSRWAGQDGDRSWEPRFPWRWQTTGAALPSSALSLARRWPVLVRPVG